MSDNLVWIPDAENGYEVAAVLARDKDDLEVQVQNTGDKRKIKIKEVEPMNPPSLDKVNDMSRLSHLNEPSVLHNLRQRYESDLIYTYSGLFLIAVNPYKRLPIYTEQVMNSHKNKRREDSDPHIYTITDNAYRQMVQNQKNQSMLITGESGAGKTENTKKVVQYLAHAAGSEGGGGKLEQQLIRTNPLLEAFGNAKTKRNNNSSRFGKFIEIDFNASGVITGCVIQHYLLETTRIVGRNEGERSFHFFYQLCVGPNAAKYNLETPDKYALLTQSKSLTVDDMDDVFEYGETITAMKVIGLSDDEIDCISAIVAAILHLGNVSFQGEKASLQDATPLQKAAHLLGADAEALGKAFMKPLFVTSTETIETHVSATQATFNRNSLMKSIYLRLFDWIVTKVNTTLNSRQHVKNFIGVLDIAGFEIFEHNSFEQLCINFTNEKLQQFFNSHMFKKEQEEYLRERIEWKYIDFGLDLQPTIDLIEKPLGIMSILDSQCIMPNPTEEGLVNEINRNQSSSKKFKTDKFSKIQFSITHYAGEVTYNVGEWLSKNIDPLNNDCRTVMQNAKNPFMSGLFPSETKVAKSRTTVATTYRAQLRGLLEILESTEPHFVRCIVPNPHKQPGVIEAKNVLHQLRCNGVLEGIRISRKGYPGRIRYTDFNSRYAILSNKKQTSLDARTQALNILSNIGFQETKQYKLGQTKVFLRAGQEATIEELREKRIALVIIFAQGAARGRLERRKFGHMLKQKASARLLQKNMRTLFKLKNDPWWQLMSLSRPIWVGTGPDEEAIKGKMSEEIQALEDSRVEAEKQRQLAEKERDATKQEIEKRDQLLLQLQREQRDLENLMSQKQDEIRKIEMNEINVESSHKNAALQIETSRNLTITLRQKIEQRDHEIDTLRSEIQTLQHNIQEKTNFIKELDGEAIDTRKMLRQLEDEMKQIRDESDRDRVLNLQVQNQTRTLDEKVRQAQTEFHIEAKARAERDQKISQLEEKTNESKQLISTTRRNTDELILQLTELRNLVNYGQMEQTELRKTIQDSTKKLRSLDLNVSEVDKRVAEETKKRLAEEARGTRLELEIIESNESIEHLKSSIEDLEKTVDELKIEIGRLKIRLNELQDENAQLIKQRDALLKEIKDVRAELTNEMKELRADLERANKRVVDKSELEQYVDQQATSALKLKKAESEVAIIQRHIQEIEQSKRLQEEKIRKTEQAIAESQTSMEDLRARLEEHEYLLQQAKNTKREMEENLRASRRDAAETIARVTAAQRAVDKLQETIEKLSADKERLSQLSSNLSDDEIRQLIQQEKKNIIDFKEQLVEKKDELSRLQIDVGELERALVKEQKNKKIEFNKIKSLQSELSNEKSIASATVKKNILLGAEMKRANANLQKYNLQVVQLSEQIEQMEKRVRGTDNETAVSRVDQSGVGKQAQELRAELDKYRDMYSEKFSELTKVRKEVSILEEKISQLEEEREDQIDVQDTLELKIDDLNYRLNLVNEKLDFELSSKNFLQNQVRDLQSENEKRRAASSRELQSMIDQLKRNINNRNDEIDDETRVAQREIREQRKQIKQVHEQIKRQHIAENKLDDPLEPIRREFEAQTKTLKQETDQERSLLKQDIIICGKLEVECVDLQDRILQEQRLAKKFEAQRKSLLGMMEDMREAAAETDQLKADIAKLKPQLEIQLRDLKKQVAKEKQLRHLVDLEVARIQNDKSSIEKEVNHQKQLSKQTNEDVARNLARSLQMLQQELERDQRKIATMERESKKMLRNYEELQFDVVEEEKIKNECLKEFESMQKQVVELSQQLHANEMLIARKQTELKRVEKESANLRVRIPLLEKDVKKLRQNKEDEESKIEMLNLRKSTMQIEMRDEIELSDDDEDDDYSSDRDEVMSEVEENSTEQSGEDKEISEEQPIEEEEIVA